MANIEKRTTSDGKVRYRALVRLKGYPAESATFERKTDAKNWASETEAAMRERRYFKGREARRHTVADLIDRYRRDVLPLKRSPRSAGLQLDWWRQELGQYVLADVTPTLVAEYRDGLASGKTPHGNRRSPSTVNRYLAILSHVFTVAVKEWAWVDANPLAKVRKLPEPRGRVRYLTDNERTELLKACRASGDPNLYPAVVLALSTGMRAGELLGLTWDDVDVHNGRAVLHETKNGERRAVPITGHALEVLREHAKVRRLRSPYVFSGRTAHGAKPADLRGAWLAALKRAEITDFRWHDLRHSTASYLAMNGASLAEIAEVLGHKTLLMARRYAHLSEQHTTTVVARMNERIFGG